MLNLKKLVTILARRKDATAAPVDQGRLTRPAEIRWSLDDYFFMRGVLFAKGWFFDTSGAPIRIRIRLWTGEIRDMQTYPMDRPDLLKIFGPLSARAGFYGALVLPKHPTSEEVSKMRVIFESLTARLEVADPVAHEHQKDPFYNSESMFWKQVADHPAPTVLEIGSRARSGITRRHLFPKNAKYIGFDYLAGENVDVVGDAHELSKHIASCSIDFAYSVVVFEHLAMPWKVAIEINRVLKVGALAAISTVQSWPLHEQPWDFYRFSDHAWDTLFNKHTGFEIVDRGMGCRCVMAPAAFIAPLHDAGLEWGYGCLATRCVVKKISETQLTWNVPTEDVTTGVYPH